MDRISEYNNTYSKEKNNWFKITKTITYPNDNSNIAIVTNIRKERLTGFEEGLISDVAITDINGNITIRKEYISKLGKMRKIETKYPDSKTANIEIYINGLLKSNLTKEKVLYKYKYDALGRQTAIVDPRTGSNKLVYNAKGQISATIDAAGNKTEYFYDKISGRQIKTKDALGQLSYTAYTQKGEIERKWGAGDYSVQFKYDNFGNMVELHTYRGNDSYNAEQGPFDTFEPDITKWNYDEKTGALLNKVYADGKGPQYIYSNSGKLLSRIWAREKNGQKLRTDYHYDPNTGNLLETDYSDETPDIKFTYNRIGQHKSVTDAVGTRTFTYNDKMQLIGEDINGIYNKTINRSYDAKGREAGFGIDDEYNVDYAYDDFGRLNKVINGNDEFTYHYLENSNLIETLEMPNGITTTKTYETKRNNILSVENKSDEKLISKYAYSYDELNRREYVSKSGAAFNTTDLINYAYDEKSQVISADATNDDNYNYSYNYDQIGNRNSYTTNKTGSAETTTYKANNLNQYTQTTNTNFEYDEEGNMTNDGKWKYLWNAENRLIQLENDSILLQFDYDYMGRRFSKKVLKEENQGWRAKEIRYFVYDNWNLISEKITKFNSPIPATPNTQFYTWGLDLSQTLQGAGGVGGLLSVKSGLIDSTYYYCYDVNGNVVQLINCLGLISANYEYSPFGKQVLLTQDLGLDNTFGFSTKYRDFETNLNYFGFRYHYPFLGRWLCRDPIMENGGFNLVIFTENDPINKIDKNGLEVFLRSKKTTYKNLLSIPKAWIETIATAHSDDGCVLYGVDCDQTSGSSFPYSFSNGPTAIGTTYKKPAPPCKCLENDNKIDCYKCKTTWTLVGGIPTPWGTIPAISDSDSHTIIICAQ